MEVRFVEVQKLRFLPIGCPMSNNKEVEREPKSSSAIFCATRVQLRGRGKTGRVSSFSCASLSLEM